MEHRIFQNRLKSNMCLYPLYIIWGYPNSWMVYQGTSQTKMDDEQGYPHDLGNLHKYCIPNVYSHISLKILPAQHPRGLRLAPRDVSPGTTATELGAFGGGDG